MFGIELRICFLIDEFCKIAQITGPLAPISTPSPTPAQTNLPINNLPPPQQFLNLLKHIPYNYHGYAGTLFGSITVHNTNDNQISPSSGIIVQIKEMIKVLALDGTILVDINLDRLGRVKFTGNQSKLLNQITTTLTGPIQASITRLLQGYDKDCPKFVIPDNGIKVNWIKLNIPKTVAK